MVYFLVNYNVKPNKNLVQLSTDGNQIKSGENHETAAPGHSFALEGKFPCLIQSSEKIE